MDGDDMVEFKVDPLIVRFLSSAKERIFGPSATVVTTNIITNVLRIGNSIILTRLLAPEDFGAIGIVMSFIYSITMLTDAGFQNYVVSHHRGDDRDFLDAVWTLQAIRGVTLALVLALVSWPLGQAFRQPDIAPLLAVSAITLAIDGAQSLSLFTALRQQLVKRLTALDLAIFLLSLVVGLGAAWVLESAWAIVASMLVSSTARTISSFVIFPTKRRLVFSREVAIDLWDFAKIIALSSTLTLLIVQTDKLLLARLFSLEQFGVYTIAANLSAAPTAIVAMYLSRIAFPNFAAAKRNDLAGIRRVNYQLRGVVYYGYLFLAGGLIGSAPLLVWMIYDYRYHEAGYLLQIVSIGTAMTMITRYSLDLFVALGHVKSNLVANGVRVIWLLLFCAISYPLVGPVGIVIAVATVEFPAYVYCLIVQSRLGILQMNLEILGVCCILLGAVVGVVFEKIVRLLI